MSQSKHAILARLDPEAAAGVRKFLEDKGYQVRQAANGKEALDWVKESVPDLVLADGVLPKLTGFELCREVKAFAESRPVPVVLVVEDGDNYGRGRARVEGADLVVVEPLLAEDMEEIVRVSGARIESADSVLASPTGARDRFVKALLRDASTKNDSFLARISDPLTGLHHRAYTTFKLEEEFKKSRRYGNPLAILLVDIENYEDVERSPDKSAAQEMLLEISGIFLCESRDVDVVGRVDDARFLLILPNTDMAGARIMADRVFQQVCARRVKVAGKDVPVRASVGIAALPSDDVSTVDEFVERALRGVHTARSLGGNRICTWSDAPRVG